MLRAVVAGAGQRRPLVLVCENLHWIDHSSEDSFAFLVGSLAGVPVLILTTHRPGYAVRWADAPGYTQIPLDRLGEVEMQEMLTALLGHDVADDVGRFIEDKTGGNPLFIEEVIRALDERQLLERETGTVRLAGSTEIEFPATIQDIIQARIDRLDDPVKQTTQIAAVIGREFDLRLLAGLAPSPADVPAHLELLKRLDLVHEARFFPELAYRFKHAVIQDVVYRTLLGSRRQILHGAVARRIEEPHGESPEEQPAVLAHHYALSQEPGRAIPFALLAGDRAARLHANAEAAAFYDQALALARALVVSPEQQRAQIDAALKRVSVSTTREAFAQDQANLEEARTLAATLADEPRMAQILYWLGRLGYVRGAFAVAADYAEQSLAIANRLGDERLAALPVNLVGRSYCVMSDYARGGELMARSVEQMKSLGNLTEEATAAGFAGERSRCWASSNARSSISIAVSTSRNGSRTRSWRRRPTFIARWRTAIRARQPKRWPTARKSGSSPSARETDFASTSFSSARGTRTRCSAIRTAAAPCSRTTSPWASSWGRRRCWPGGRHCSR
jgi:hypothetical protein